MISNKNDVSDALIELGGQGLRDDLAHRTVLLRVLTDLFVLKRHHSSDEVRQFEEIFPHMFDAVADETRTLIADKLANYCATPHIVVRHLLFRGGQSAVVLLEKSRAIARETLGHVASFGDAPLAAAVARRPDLDLALVRALAARTESQVLLALAENTLAAIPRALFRSLIRRARRNSLLAHALIARADKADDIAPLFLVASPDARAAIISASRRGSLGRPPRVSRSFDAAVLAELEELGCASDRTAFTAALARVTGATKEEMLSVVRDHHGEPLALVLAALGMSPEAATRIFLTSEPAIGHSYERVAALQHLVAEISSDTARELVVRFLDRAPRRPRYVPATDTTAHSTPSRPGFVAFIDPARKSGRSHPRARRSAEHARK